MSGTILESWGYKFENHKVPILTEFRMQLENHTPNSE